MPGGEGTALVRDDIIGIAIEAASVVVINFTLQFLDFLQGFW